MLPGAAVEFGDQVPGGGDHDRVKPSGSVGSPSAERIFGGGGDVPDMNPAVINIEVERPQVAPRRTSDAAASAESVKRCSSVSRKAPWVWAMSRSTPPAPIAPSC